jgi:hypothetical protein
MPNEMLQHHKEHNFGRLYNLLTMTKTLHRQVAAPYNDELYLHKRSLAVRSSLSLSPDGRLAAVTIQGLASDVENSKPVEAKWLDAISEEIVGSEVLVVNLESGEITRPFQTFCTSFLPAWSPDGREPRAFDAG